MASGSEAVRRRAAGRCVTAAGGPRNRIGRGPGPMPSEQTGVMEKKRISRGTLGMMTRHRPTMRVPTGHPGPEGGQDDPGRTKTTEAHALANSVGEQIRSLRRAAGLTTVELATRAGLSNGMLSKIERGTAHPSFVSIASIARALEVPVARLFASYDNRRDCSFVRAGQGLIVDRRGSKSGHSYELLGHLLSGEIYVEPYFVKIEKSGSGSASFQHTGIEFMYILSGSMKFRYADRMLDVGPGDSLLFDANAVHGAEEILNGPVSLLSVVINLRA